MLWPGLYESRALCIKDGFSRQRRTTEHGHIGLFEAANGGTLSLDELPSLSPHVQARVLTAIEEHRVRRVGENESIAIDVRLIPATNQDLRKLVEAGKFREDLRPGLFTSIRTHVRPGWAAYLNLFEHLL